jgi:hypothetical protein
MSKDTAANPSGTLFDYPTSELKNLAKEYNLAYYINNIERLSKADLVEAIMDHMNWKKEQEEVDNRVQFKKSMKGIALNYDKTRDKKNPRQRLNYEELKKAHPVLTAKRQEIPKYKGKKDWSQTHLKEISPAVVEAVQDKVPGVAEVLSQFRKMTEAQQRQLIGNLGLTEAQVLPPGVPALGEMEAPDEAKVANTIHQILEVVQEANPMKGIEISPKSTNKLEEFKKKLGDPPQSFKGYFPKIDSWRYVAIAEELLKKPLISQRDLGKELEKKGWNIGVSQSTISKLLPEIKKLGLLEKPTAAVPDKKKEEPKPVEKKEEVAEPPAVKDPYPPYKPLGDQFENFLSKIRLRVMKRYKDDAEEVRPSEKASYLRGYESLKIAPFFMKGMLFVGIQGTAQPEEQRPGSNSWTVYNYDEEQGDINYEIGVTEPTKSLFKIKVEETWQTSKGLISKERAMRKKLEEITVPNSKMSEIRFNEFAGVNDADFPGLRNNKDFALPSEKPDVSEMLKKLNELNLKGGIIVDPDTMNSKKSFPNRWNDNDTPIVEQTLFSSRDGTFKVMKIAEDLAHILENVNPAEALGWRLIYHELFEYLERQEGRTIVPATYDPAILKKYTAEDLKMTQAEFKAHKKKQYEHGLHIQSMLVKAVRGLSPGSIAAMKTDSENYVVPSVYDLEKKLIALRTKYPTLTTENLQHKPKKYDVKNSLKF